MKIVHSPHLVTYRELLLRNHASQQQRTYIVVGCSRGGTSALGFILASLGIPMGAPEGSFAHEDNQFRPEYLSDRELVKSHINKRDTGSNVWGMKMPAAIFELDWLQHLFRNPIVICVYRNPLGVCRSVIARDDNYTNDLTSNQRALLHPLRYYEAFARHLPNSIVPSVACQYEDLVANPESFLREFCPMVGLTPTEDQIKAIAAAVSKPGYKPPLTQP